jgi:tRNA A-37 threonylcarbamoyl transferase component Bud32
MKSVRKRITEFAFEPGRRIAGKYIVAEKLGAGWEGEVYKVIERITGIPRAAKLFYPHRNQNDRAALFYARKLNRLRQCPIVIQYHHSEVIRFRGENITCMISELVEGELLCNFIAGHAGKRLHYYEALHLLYALAVGMDQIHNRKEYHSDIHSENVIVSRIGVRFNLRLVDFFDWGTPTAGKIQEDVIQMVQLLYEAVGGRKHYAKQPQEIKRICCGLRRDLICRKFPTAGHLRVYLETFPWQEK